MRKFTPSAPLADNFVRETDWQKDDHITVTNDVLYAQTWNTNFGTNPFDIEPPDHEQDDVTVSFSDEIIINIFLYGTRICSDKVPTLPRNFKK